jgi:uncharacterized glyoxalase superfamily protein PhnB
MAESTGQGGEIRQTVTAYMAVRNAAEAIEFYKRAFGATEVNRMANPQDGKILHAELRLGNSSVFLADESPQFGFVSPLSTGTTTVGIHLHVDSADATVERAAGAGATVTMPPMDMFWGDRFAKVADPFGHHWSITQTLEVLTPEQMQERMIAAMSKPGNCGEAVSA